MIEETPQTQADEVERADAPQAEPAERDQSEVPEMELDEFGETPYTELNAFDQLVSEVIDELPAELAPLIDSMAIVVEDEPPELDLASEDVADDGAEPLSQYRGVPGPPALLGGGLTGPAAIAPAEIALFQGPLERASADEEHLRQLVKETLLHELRRHLGMIDDDAEADEDDADDVDFDDEETEQ